jgi:hypothetical protein
MNFALRGTALFLEIPVLMVLFLPKTTHPDHFAPIKLDLTSKILPADRQALINIRVFTILYGHKILCPYTSYPFRVTIFTILLPTADCRLLTADCRLLTADCRLPTFLLTIPLLDRNHWLNIRLGGLLENKLT